MSKPVTIIDDIVFGKNPSYPLPVHNQHTWISQIDATGSSFDEYVALTHSSINLKNIIVDVFTGDIPHGDKRNKLLVDYDNRLLEALKELRHSNPADKGIFDSYLHGSIEDAFGFMKLPSRLDTAFVINMYGNAWRYFPQGMTQPSKLERVLDVVTGRKRMTVDHTLLAAAATATDYATAMKDGVIELSSEQRDSLVETASSIANAGEQHGAKEGLSALRQAIQKLENAPVLEPAGLAM